MKIVKNNIFILTWLISLSGCAIYADLSILNDSSTPIVVSVDQYTPVNLDIGAEANFGLAFAPANYINISYEKENNTYRINPLSSEYRERKIISDRYRFIYKNDGNIYVMDFKNEKKQIIKLQPEGYPLKPEEKGFPKVEDMILKLNKSNTGLKSAGVSTPAGTSGRDASLSRSTAP